MRSFYKNPGDPDVLPPPDAIVVVPATVNTITKWAAGIADTLALGLLVEGQGKGLPIVALPFTNSAMGAHPAFRRGHRAAARLGHHGALRRRRAAAASARHTARTWSPRSRGS